MLLPAPARAGVSRNSRPLTEGFPCREEPTLREDWAPVKPRFWFAYLGPLQAFLPTSSARWSFQKLTMFGVTAPRK